MALPWEASHKRTRSARSARGSWARRRLHTPRCSSPSHCEELPHPSANSGARQQLLWARACTTTLSLPKLSLPCHRLQGGVFQRWRVAWATIKRFAILTIADPATGQPSPDCELLLLSKDGVYLQKLPRKVDHIFLSPGNRPVGGGVVGWVGGWVIG